MKFCRLSDHIYTVTDMAFVGQAILFCQACIVLNLAEAAACGIVAGPGVIRQFAKEKATQRQHMLGQLLQLDLQVSRRLRS